LVRITSSAPGASVVVVVVDVLVLVVVDVLVVVLAAVVGGVVVVVLTSVEDDDVTATLDDVELVSPLAPLSLPHATTVSVNAATDTSRMFTAGSLARSIAIT
jgi:hypothetical protein